MDWLLAALQNDPAPSDPHRPVTTLKWLLDHGGGLVWVIVLLLGVFGWLAKRVRAWGASNPGASQAMRAWIAEARAAAEAAQSGATTPQQREASLRQWVQEARSLAVGAASPPAQPQPQHGSKHGKHREKRADAAPPQSLPSEAPQPIAPMHDDVPVQPRHSLLDALGGPRSAATGIVLAEVLGPPVAFR